MTNHFPEKTYEPGGDAIHSRISDSCWRISLVNSQVHVELRAPTDEALMDLALLVLNQISVAHWTTKAEMVPLARALSIDVTENNTVAEIKAAIAEA